mmetsp:Transcript_242/g.547  ORF Transcript_242/g.547 Transcript_242/m.547 type:complete len:242 (-) Transcript_242:50-775(-)
MTSKWPRRARVGTSSTHSQLRGTRRSGQKSSSLPWPWLGLLLSSSCFFLGCGNSDAVVRVLAVVAVALPRGVRTLRRFSASRGCTIATTMTTKSSNAQKSTSTAAPRPLERSKCAAARCSSNALAFPPPGHQGSVLLLLVSCSSRSATMVRLRRELACTRLMQPTPAAEPSWQLPDHPALNGASVQRASSLAAATPATAATKATEAQGGQVRPCLLVRRSGALPGSQAWGIWDCRPRWGGA